MTLPSIRPVELAEKQQRGEAFALIDVRTPVEFQEIHCPFARNLPLSDLDPARLKQDPAWSVDQPLYLICRSGSRAKQAGQRLSAAGWKQVAYVEGGTLAWQQAGLPVNTGKKVISLERQTRIGAGVLVLSGLALGYFVHPYCLGLTAFVGAGLIFAGITDICGMGLLLARMPWNQVLSHLPCGSKPSECTPANRPAISNP